MERSTPDFGLPYITEEHYTGFGMIVHMCSHIDAMIDRIIVSMNKSHALPQFYPLLTFLSSRDKRDYVIALAKISTLPPWAVNGLETFMDRAKTAFALRNDVAHNLWRRGRRKGTIKPTVLSARGVLKILGISHNEREWTASQLIAEAQKIHALGVELNMFMRSYDLDPPLPNIPP
jgi:hypothetical protein